MARRGLGVVYGGGNVGLMGILADSCLAAGGEVIGVIPQALVERELVHGGLNDLRIVHSMHERKALMAELSDAFIALPGGLGTLDEFCEVLTWTQLGLHAKPCALLNTHGFYDPFLNQVDRALELGFTSSSQRDLLLVDADPESLLDRLSAARPPEQHRWISKQES